MAGLKAGDTVVEIGPGLGTLTLALLKAGAQVFAIELDKRLAAHLRETLCVTYRDTMHLLEGDAVNNPLAGLPQNIEGDFKIIANLPYAITSPWIDAVLQGPLPERMVLMVQKEAADRLCASPGTKAFSALSIFLQSAYRLEVTHRVSKQCFYPAPDVDSALITLVRQERPFSFSAEVRAVISMFFQQRRKQIGTLCKQQKQEALMAWLHEAGIPENTRPEAIAIEHWQRLKASR